MLSQSIDCPGMQLKILIVQKETVHEKGQETLQMNVQLFQFCFLFLAAELRLGS